MPDSGEESIKMLTKINTQLREAVLACFPCAYEQYVTIQMPGTIIDTTLGGRYIVPVEYTYTTMTDIF